MRYPNNRGEVNIDVESPHTEGSISIPSALTNAEANNTLAPIHLQTHLEPPGQARTPSLLNPRMLARRRKQNGNWVMWVRITILQVTGGNSLVQMERAAGDGGGSIGDTLDDDSPR